MQTVCYLKYSDRREDGYVLGGDVHSFLYCCFVQENACQHVDPTSRQDYMASPQCTHGTDVRVTKDICFPSETTILKEVKKVMKKTKAKYLFVASDTDPMVKKLTTYLKQLKVWELVVVSVMFSSPKKASVCIHVLRSTTSVVLEVIKKFKGCSAYATLV